MKVYTRKGDDGSTGLLYGGRVSKDSPLPRAYGAVDEAQAVIGVARSLSERDGEIDAVLTAVARHLWVLMAELATDPGSRGKLSPGNSLVTEAMVTELEVCIDDFSARFAPPTEFVIPGENPIAAQLDVARTVVRRAERDTIAAMHDVGDEVFSGSFCVHYLNRLSDLLWTMARWCEGESRPARPVA